MRKQDVEQLYKLIPKGAKVHIDGAITGTGKGENKNLSVGSKGNLVQLVQERLKGMGLYEGPSDGIYDVANEKAVEKFQKIHYLSINRVISMREYLLLGQME